MFALNSLGVFVTADFQRLPATPLLCFWELPTTVVLPQLAHILAMDDIIIFTLQSYKDA